MRYIVLFVFLIKSFVNADAQILVNYSTIDGLSSDFVECIEVDIYDNIWVGSSLGVQKFDGLNWTLYNTNSYPSMASDNIKVISSISNGDIWIGTDFGVSRFDGIDWFTYDVTNGLNNNQVYSIDETDDGIIWIGTHSGVSFYDGSNWNSYGFPDIHWSGVNGVTNDMNGHVWFSTPLGGVIHKVNSNFITYDTSSGLLSQNTTSIAIDNNNNKWIGTGGGVSVLDSLNYIFTHHTRMYIMPPPDTLNPVVDIEIDYNNNPWIAIYVGYLAEGGVAMWKHLTSDWLDYDHTDGLVGKNIKDISIDSENNIWIATTTGVSKLILDVNSDNYEKFNRNELIFPNPSNDILTISHFHNQILNFKIFNNFSQLVYSGLIEGNEKELDISHLNKGIYYLMIQKNSNEIISYKFIVQ
ncbi:MAG: hypothetical protein CMP51_01440 [Flavobacteriales bacterium]|nr:hypothetical protein [Flavobacteriales bacterium]